MTTAGEKSKIENSRHVKPQQQPTSISPKNGQQLMFRFVCKLRRHLLPQRKIIRFLFAFSTLFFVIFLVWLEETCIGHIANFYGNFHWRIVYQPIEVRRKSLLDQRINISVFVVLDSAERLADYGLAHRTLRCYCQLHGYPLRVLDLSREPMLRRECPQLDFMFRRHCALARFLAAHPEVEFALFLDADMGVVNPNHLLEERVHPNGHGDDFDLVLYERTFNGEIMAGSYFLRNSPFAIQFLHFWANYEFKVPMSFHGTDNGAIHAVFLDLFCGQNCADQRLRCSRLWNASLNFATLVPFTACARNVLGDRNVFHSVPGETEILATGGKVILLTNFTQFWARDGWLTRNSFSPNDFIFHGWQKRYLDQPGFASWHSPLALSDDLHFDTNSCLTHALASLNWPYKDTFVCTDEGIAVQMSNIVRQRREETLNVLKENLW